MTKPDRQRHFDKGTVLALGLGLLSMTSQILLLREFLTVFYGNETAYAIILASWLFWVAGGSFVMSRLSRRLPNAGPMLSLGLYLAAVILPATIVAVRCVNVFLGIRTGEIVGIIPMLGPAFILLAPLAFIFGCSYSLICQYVSAKRSTGTAVQSVGTVYILEALGAAVGGVLISLFLISFLSSMAVATLLGLVIIGVVTLTLRSRRWLVRLGWLLMLFIFAMSLTGQVHKLDRFSRRVQWQGFDIVSITDSIYGNIALVKVGTDYSLYESGLLSYTTKEFWQSEERIHFALLSHPQPQRVLLVGSALDGSLREILKHPIKTCDYIELDPSVNAVSQRYLPQELLASLTDPRVTARFTDARHFIKQVQGTYDVIILNLPDPYNALINRYYTFEFFQEVKRVLGSQGVVSLAVSSSENYLNKETQDFLRSLNTTLKQSFPAVVSIPGDMNIFLAGVQKGQLTLDAQLFVQRLKDRGVETQYMREYYLPFKLSNDRIRYIDDILKTSGVINSDMHPIAYLYDILLWSTHFDTTFRSLFGKVQGLRFKHLLVIPGLVLLVGGIISRYKKTFPIGLSILTTGSSEIVFQLIVVLAFQTLYGYAYYKLGFIMASFMAGLALGSLAAKKFMTYGCERQLRIYKVTQLAICIYPLLLPIVFRVFRDIFVQTSLLGLFATCFAALPVIAGFIGGVQYPLATSLAYAARTDKESSIAKPAGGLYAVDVLGAALGALVTGSVLIPILGIALVAYFFALINLAVFILLMRVRM